MMDRVVEQLRKAPAETGRTLDFFAGGAGRDAAMMPDDREGLRLTGHCWWPERPQPGDHIILRAGIGRTSRYRLVKVTPCGDPPDMYAIEAVFDPRPPRPPQPVL